VRAGQSVCRFGVKTRKTPVDDRKYGSTHPAARRLGVTRPARCGSAVVLQVARNSESCSAERKRRKRYAIAEFGNKEGTQKEG